MTWFRYRAREKDSNIVNSLIEAESRNEAIEKISRLGLYPVSVIESTGTMSMQKRGRNFRKTSAGKESLLFVKQLSNFLRAGIPILKAIGLIREHVGSANMYEVLGDLHEKMKKGKSLSEAMYGHADIFDPLQIAMIEAGEAGGLVAENLSLIAEYKKQQQEVAAKVRNALFYPMMVVVLGILSVVFILTYVLPRLTELILSLNLELPLPTVLLISLSGFLKKSYLWIILTASTAIILFKAMLRNEHNRTHWDAVKLKIPFFGKIMQKVEWERFVRTFYMCQRNGLSMLRSLTLSAGVLKNLAIKNEIADFFKEVEGGRAFGACLKRSIYAPEWMGDLVTIGEESGKLEETLEAISEDFKDDIETGLKTFTTLLEPLIILVLGAVVGFIVIAVLLPIFQLDILAV